MSPHVHAALLLVVGVCTVLPTSDAHTWTYSHGAIAAGNDLIKKNTTVAQAKVDCASLEHCVGFTYDSKDANLTSIVQVYFKKTRYINLDGTWSSWILDAPPPAPTTPML